MYKYKIQKGGVSYVIESNQNKASLKHNPALFFLCNGNYEVERCGNLKAFKQLKSHFFNIAKKLGVSNV